MNLKNLLKALFAFVFGVVLFASCEKDPVIDNGDGSTSLGEKPAYVASDKVYLCGNCTSSDLSSATMMGYGDGEEHTFGGATLLTLDQLLDAGYYVVGVRVYIGDEVESGNVFIGTDYENPEVVKDFTYTK